MIESKDVLKPRSYGLNESIWNFVPLNSVVFFQEGPGLRNWQWTSSGMKVINIKNILWNRTVNTNNSDKYISLNEFERSYRHFEVDDKDIVMASSGDTYSKIGRINSGNLPLMMNTSVIRFKSLNEELLNNDFLYFFLCSNYMKNQIDCFVTGSAQPNFGPYHLNRMSIPIPSIKAQKKIADILSAYDDLIENNLKRIKLLEQAAQNIFKEWFVHLRFPEHEKAVINKETGLPEGWEEVVMEDIMNVSGGGTPSTKEPLYWEEGKVLWFSPTDLNKNNSLVLIDSTKKITELGLKKSSAKLLPKRTILMSSRATIGLFGLFNGECSTNQGFININPKHETHRYYILFNLKSRVEELISNSSGATFKELSKRVFKRMSILNPNEEILNLFYNIVEPIINQTENLEVQNQKLKAARDILLPRLMNRTIEV